MKYEKKKVKGVNSNSFSLANVSEGKGKETTSEFSLSRTTAPKGSAEVNSPRHFGISDAVGKV